MRLFIILFQFLAVKIHAYENTINDIALSAFRLETLVGDLITDQVLLRNLTGKPTSYINLRQKRVNRCTKKGRKRQFILPLGLNYHTCNIKLISCSKLSP